MRDLLDTNTCIAIMRNRPAAVRRLASVAPSDCAVSTITSYELHTVSVRGEVIKIAEKDFLFAETELGRQLLF
jgi:predicted nucleic acid-binding protein